MEQLQAPASARYAEGGGAMPGEEGPFDIATREWARQWPTEEL